jgi:hypothetical protein
MSIENAILELAAALRYAADISAEATRANTAGYEAMSKAYLAASSGGGPLVVEQKANPAREAVMAEVQKAITKKEKAAEVKPDAELDQAVAKVEADAKKLAGAAEATKTDTAASTAGSAAAPDTDDAEPLNYDKDVKPALLAFIKANSQEACRKLLTDQFGVARATDLKVEQYPAVLAAIKG